MTRRRPCELCGKPANGSRHTTDMHLCGYCASLHICKHYMKGRLEDRAAYNAYSNKLYHRLQEEKREMRRLLNELSNKLLQVQGSEAAGGD
jgi:ribosome-binding protein aMBF1 (putative translation factor)